MSTVYVSYSKRHRENKGYKLFPSKELKVNFVLGYKDQQSAPVTLLPLPSYWPLQCLKKMTREFSEL